MSEFLESPENGGFVERSEIVPPDFAARPAPGEASPVRAGRELPRPALGETLRRALIAVWHAEAQGRDIALLEASVQRRRHPQNVLQGAEADDHGASDDLIRFDAVLRASLTMYVRELRATNWPPERMLADVKRIFHESVPVAARVDHSATHLLERIVRWSIEAYYDVPATRQQ